MNFTFTKCLFKTQVASNLGHPAADFTKFCGISVRLQTRTSNFLEKLSSLNFLYLFSLYFSKICSKKINACQNTASHNFRIPMKNRHFPLESRTLFGIFGGDRSLVGFYSITPPHTFIHHGISKMTQWIFNLKRSLDTRLDHTIFAINK